MFERVGDNAVAPGVKILVRGLVGLVLLFCHHRDKKSRFLLGILYFLTTSLPDSKPG